MKKRIFVFFLILSSLPYAEASDAMSVGLNNEQLKVQLIRYDPVFDLSLSTVYSSSTAQYDFGFSFYSEKLRAGKISLSGVWKELFNPFGYTVTSSVYTDESGVDKDFTPGSGGTYGIFLSLPLQIDLTFLYPSFGWVGVKKSILLGSGSSLTLFSAVSGEQSMDSDSWSEKYSFMSRTRPMHLGFEADIRFYQGMLSFLFFSSGNPYFRSGKFMRVFLKTRFHVFCFSLLSGYSDKDYILPSGGSVEGHFSGSVRIEYFPLAGISLAVTGKYHVNHLPAYPVHYTETVRSVSLSGVWERGPLKLKLDGEKYFTGPESGPKDNSYSLDGKIRAKTGPGSLTLSVLEKGTGKGPYFRKGQVESLIHFGPVSVQLSCFLMMDRSVSGKLQFGEIFRVETKHKSGQIFFSCAFEQSDILSKAAGLKNLNIGWKSRF